MLKRHRYAAVSATALALMLAGCSGGGAPSKAPTQATQESAAAAETTVQSKNDACKIVQDSFAKLNQLSSTIDPKDPQAALDSLKKLSDESAAAVTSITNEEIKPVAQKASAALSDYVAFLQGVVADPSTAGKMGEQITTLQESFTAVGKACSS